MMNLDAVDDLRKLRESEARRGLRAVSLELLEVGQGLLANGEDGLAAEVKTLRQMADELLSAMKPTETFLTV